MQIKASVSIPFVRANIVAKLLIEELEMIEEIVLPLLCSSGSGLIVFQAISPDDGYPVC